MAAVGRDASVVVLAADPQLRTSVATSLGKYPSISLAASTERLTVAIDTVRSDPVDVALVAGSIDELDALTAGRILQTVRPSLSVLLHTDDVPDGTTLTDGIDAGIAGFVVRPGAHDLAEAIVAAAQGEAVLNMVMVRRIKAGIRALSPRLYDLTPRELAVLQLLARGRSTLAIADELGISSTTVRNYVQNLLAKLNAHSRLEAVMLVLRDGLVTLDE